ncbi:MAG: thioredoxin-disulfide reductase [Chloroflexi bacterium]|nr:MAG: thioredoxin-disulfide reductase [Chloroflexota bacterium]
MGTNSREVPVDDRSYDIAIIGGGPAGLTAALYAGRSMVRSVLIEAKAPGGQLLNTELIEDYPGFVSVDGHELAGYMVEQATRFGTDLVISPTHRIRVLDDGMKVVETDEGEFRAPAVIITAGGNPRKLEVPGEVEYAGKGVSYCAVCDGAFFKGEHLAVVGGGDAAVEEAVFLTRYASKVTIIHRRNEFRAQPVLVQEARHSQKVSLLMDTVVESIEGSAIDIVTGAGRVTHLALRNVVTGEPSALDVGGVFVFVGFIPNTGLVDQHIEHDPSGYYLTDPYTMMTSVPGIYAAGDVRSQLTRQVTTAVGDATTATIAASKWVEERAKGNHAAAGMAPTPPEARRVG